VRLRLPALVVSRRASLCSAGVFALLVSFAPAGAARAAQLGFDPSVGIGVADVPVPDPAGAGGVRQASGAFLSYGFSTYLRLRGALMSQAFTYSLFGTEYRGSEIPGSLAQGLSWQITGTPSGKSELSVMLSAARTSTSAVFPVSAQGAQTGSTTALPFGASTVTTASLTEALTLQPNGKESYGETGQASLSRTTGTTDFTALLVTGLLTAKSLQGHDTYSANLLLGGTWFLSQETNTPTNFNSGAVFTGQLTGGWGRLYSAATSTDLQVGLLSIWRPNTDDFALAPAFLGALNYTARPWFATLSIFQQPIMNNFFGTVVVGDGVSLRVSLPLNQLETWTVSALAGYTYGRAVSSGFALFDFDRAYELYTASATSTYNFQRYPFFVSLAAMAEQQRGASGSSFPTTTRMFALLSVGAALEWGEGSRGLRRP